GALPPARTREPPAGLVRRARLPGAGRPGRALARGGVRLARPGRGAGAGANHDRRHDEESMAPPPPVGPHGRPASAAPRPSPPRLDQGGPGLVPCRSTSGPGPLPARPGLPPGAGVGARVRGAADPPARRGRYRHLPRRLPPHEPPRRWRSDLGDRLDRRRHRRPPRRHRPHRLALPLRLRGRAPAGRTGPPPVRGPPPGPRLPGLLPAAPALRSRPAPALDATAPPARLGHARSRRDEALRAVAGRPPGQTGPFGLGQRRVPPVDPGVAVIHAGAWRTV